MIILFKLFQESTKATGRLPVAWTFKVYINKDKQKVYKIADKKQGAAIIQEDGKTYTMAMVSEEDADLAKIGDSINNWMIKQK